MDEQQVISETTPTSAEPSIEASSAAVPVPTPPEGDSGGGGRSRRRWNILWREWFRPLLLIAVVMFSFRSAVADWNDVPTGSMKPTILEGDRIFINKVAYDLKFPFTRWRLAEWSDPTWGDIVVLLSPDDGKRLVKRVVGLPGDVIEIRSDWRLYVNGEEASYLRLDEETAAKIDLELLMDFNLRSEMLADRPHPVMTPRNRPSVDRNGPFTVPEDHFFVMGDNRSNSRDSRWFGSVHRSDILGQATGVALSVDPKRHYAPRWSRFFSSLK